MINRYDLVFLLFIKELHRVTIHLGDVEKPNPYFIFAESYFPNKDKKFFS